MRQGWGGEIEAPALRKPPLSKVGRELWAPAGRRRLFTGAARPLARPPADPQLGWVSTVWLGPWTDRGSETGRAKPSALPLTGEGSLPVQVTHFLPVRLSRGATGESTADPALGDLGRVAGPL